MPIRWETTTQAAPAAVPPVRKEQHRVDARRALRIARHVLQAHSDQNADKTLQRPVRTMHAPCFFGESALLPPDAQVRKAHSAAAGAVARVEEPTAAQ